jgi:hypothetical protein
MFENDGLTTPPEKATERVSRADYIATEGQDPAREAAGSLASLGLPPVTPEIVEPLVESLVESVAEPVVEPQIAPAGPTTDELVAVGAGVVKLVRRTTGEVIDLVGESIRVGRKEGFVDYVVRDNKLISGIHAEFTNIGTGWALTDLNSTNHVRINEVQLDPSLAYELNNGDVIRLANENFDFFVP